MYLDNTIHLWDRAALHHHLKIHPRTPSGFHSQRLLQHRGPPVQYCVPPFLNIEPLSKLHVVVEDKTGHHKAHHVIRKCLCNADIRTYVQGSLSEYFERRGYSLPVEKEKSAFLFVFQPSPDIHRSGRNSYGSKNKKQ